ncbi:hypothetical protein BgiBS90_001817, partial [Biomphalaria glabrata]
MFENSLEHSLGLSLKHQLSRDCVLLIIGAASLMYERLVLTGENKPARSFFIHLVGSLRPAR